jgi:hypothetical protein
MGRSVVPTEYTEHTEIENERTFPAAALNSLFSDRRGHPDLSDYLLLQCVPWATDRIEPAQSVAYITDLLQGPKD